MRNFSKLNSKLYRCGSPTIKDIKLLKSKFNIEKVISLSVEDGKKISGICNHLGIQQIFIPLEIHKRTSILHLLNHNFDELFTVNGPTLIHCHAGKDRTGLVCALIRCKYFNWDCERALNEAISFGFGKGVPDKTINTYINLICNFCNKDHHHINVSDDDIKKDFNVASDTMQSIVSNERDDMTSAQESFAPYLDFRTNSYPYTNPYDDGGYVENDYHDNNYEEGAYGGDLPMPWVGFYNPTSSYMGGAGITEAY